jgi:hypothetical protein
MIDNVVFQSSPAAGGAYLQLSDAAPKPTVVHENAKISNAPAPGRGATPVYGQPGSNAAASSTTYSMALLYTALGVLLGGVKYIFLYHPGEPAQMLPVPGAGDAPSSDKATPSDPK